MALTDPQKPIRGSDYVPMPDIPDAKGDPKAHLTEVDITATETAKKTFETTNIEVQNSTPKAKILDEGNPLKRLADRISHLVQSLAARWWRGAKAIASALFGTHTAKAAPTEKDERIAKAIPRLESLLGQKLSNADNTDLAFQDVAKLSEDLTYYRTSLFDEDPFKSQAQAVRDVVQKIQSGEIKTPDDIANSPAAKYITNGAVLTILNSLVTE